MVHVQAIRDLSQVTEKFVVENPDEELFPDNQVDEKDTDVVEIGVSPDLLPIFGQRILKPEGGAGSPVACGVVRGNKAEDGQEREQDKELPLCFWNFKACDERAQPKGVQLGKRQNVDHHRIKMGRRIYRVRRLPLGRAGPR